MRIDELIAEVRARLSEPYDGRFLENEELYRWVNLELGTLSSKLKFLKKSFTVLGNGYLVDLGTSPRCFELPADFMELDRNKGIMINGLRRKGTTEREIYDMQEKMLSGNLETNSTISIDNYFSESLTGTIFHYTIDHIYADVITGDGVEVITKDYYSDAQISNLVSGDSYLVAATAAGTWIGKTGYLATVDINPTTDAVTWTYRLPALNEVIFVRDINRRVIASGTGTYTTQAERTGKLFWLTSDVSDTDTIVVSYIAQHPIYSEANDKSTPYINPQFYDLLIYGVMLRANEKMINAGWGSLSSYQVWKSNYDSLITEAVEFYSDSAKQTDKQYRIKNARQQYGIYNSRNARSYGSGID